MSASAAYAGYSRGDGRCHMTHLACEAVLAAHDAAMCDNGAADAGSRGDHDAGIGTASGAPAGFTHRISLHVVQNGGGKARALIQCRCERLSAPAWHEVVRVGDISRLRVDASSGSHSDAERGGGGARGEVASERANLVEDACSALQRLGRHGARIFHDGFGFGGIVAHDAAGDLGPAHIDCDDARWKFAVRRKGCHAAP